MGFELGVPFLIGLLSAVHCVGMCGGIMAALTMNVADSMRARRARLVVLVTAYNLGRICSYALAGALMGWIGQPLFEFISPQYGHLILRSVAAILLIGIGLYLAGWFPRFAVIETMGVPLWRRLQPLGRKLLPVRNTPAAWMFGLIWGWLPCGLVYSTLLLSASTGSPWRSSIFMLIFGLGTLPAVMATGLMAGTLTNWARRPRLRQAAGLVLIGMALFSLWPGSHSGHVQQTDHAEQEAAPAGGHQH